MAQSTDASYPTGQKWKEIFWKSQCIAIRQQPALQSVMLTIHLEAK